MLNDLPGLLRNTLPEKVNELRKQVGLTTTIEESAAALNAHYDPYEPLPTENVWEK